MGYKSKAFAGVRVELGNGYWAQVRPLTGDEALALGEATQVERADNGAALRLLLTTAVVAWNLDDDDDAPLPITAANVAALTTRDQICLILAAKALNNPLADETAKGN